MCGYDQDQTCRDLSKFVEICIYSVNDPASQYIYLYSKLLLTHLLGEFSNLVETSLWGEQHALYT